MEKTIMVGDKAVRMRATAAVPRLYRIKFGRDIFADLAKLSDGMEAAKTKQEQFQVTDLEVFENVAYMMAKHADPQGVPSDVWEWLDGFETFAIMDILPELLDLWCLNMQTTAESKKKLVQLAGT